MQKPKPVGPRVCIIDIETSPGIAHVWGLFKQNISLNQLQEATRVISFAAKWYGEKEIKFFSEFHDGRAKMIRAAHDFLSEADIIVHYNGSEFDIPHLKREFWEMGLKPPAPFLEVDLLKAVKRSFRFMSNKMQHICEKMKIGSKVEHSGHELWVKCLLGDKQAWSLMREYNKKDVSLTEQLYNSILPWIDNHPHVGLVSGNSSESCNRCGSSDLESRGFAYTKMTAYRRYKCKDCGGWSRGATRVNKTSITGIK